MEVSQLSPTQSNFCPWRCSCILPQTTPHSKVQFPNFALSISPRCVGPFKALGLGKSQPVPLNWESLSTKWGGKLYDWTPSLWSLWLSPKTMEMYDWAPSLWSLWLSPRSVDIWHWAPSLWKPMMAIDLCGWESHIPIFGCLPVISVSQQSIN